MVAVLSVIKGKNKVIVSGLAGALSTLVFLTMIHIAAKIAIIVAAATVTYTLLSLAHKVAAKFAKTAETSKDEGYNSVDKGEEKDTVEEPEKTEAELEEELKNKRAQECMEKGSLGGPINAFGEPILDEIKNTDSANCIKTMVMPDKIVLGEPDDKTLTQNNSSFVKGHMKPLPEHMDVLGNPLPGQLSSNLELEKLSPSSWLRQYGSINDNERRVLERPIIPKEFNGLRF